MSDSRVAGDLTERVRLTCVVTSHPAPKFSWSRDNKLVTSLGRISSQVEDQLSDTLYKSTLTISSVKKGKGMGHLLSLIQDCRILQPPTPPKITILIFTPICICPKMHLRNVVF